MDNKTVIIKNVKYRGKANKIKWKKVENDLKCLIGKKVIIDKYNEEIIIGKDFPDEFVGSKYTAKLKGALVKVKANIISEIVNLVKNAYNERHQENKSEKHTNDAKFGWKRYDTSFSIPIFDDKGTIEYYNDYIATIVVRCDKDGNKYLYDFIDIKKGKCTPHG